MSCGEAGRKKSTYTGNQVGALNFVGPMNFVAGGPPGSGLSAGTTVVDFISAPENRRVWLRRDAKFDDKLLDAAFPTINLQWYADIEFDPQTTFRVSDRSFYIKDESGVSRYYDARCERAPTITSSVGEWLQQGYEVGDASLTLNNRDGFFNDYLPMGAKFRQWTGVKVTIYIGFGEDRSNYMPLFEGQVTDKSGLTASRDSIELKCYDKFDLDEIPVPPRTFNSENFPDIDDAFKNKYVPLVYGDWSQDVPAYGAVNAVCVNAREDDPEYYRFKISDLGLEEITEVYLHRGERTADKPQGPIRIADNVIIRDEDSGEFLIPSSGFVLDEPYYIATRIKAGQGTTSTIITSDNGFNFLEQGVKVGDTIVNRSETQARVVLGNLEFKPTAKGAAGNSLGFEIYLLPTSFVEDYDSENDRYKIKPGMSTSKCYASYDAGLNRIRVGVTQYHDKNNNVVIGKRTAGAIKAAIADNLTTNALVRVAIVGSVPFGYPENTRPSEVNQNVPAGPVTAQGGQNADREGTITSVSNFQVTVSSGFSYAPDVEYSISTVQYKFLKNDKFTVKCLGKNLNLASVDRLSDISTAIRRPNGISVSPEATAWICDDATQKIYEISFDGEILRELTYTSIHPSITKLSSVNLASDYQLYVTAPDQSTIYRYDVKEAKLGATYHTSAISGIGMALADLQGVSVKPDQRFWIVDSVTHLMHLVDTVSGVAPFVVRTLDTRTADPGATEPLDISFDTQTGHLTFVDRNTNAFYRVDETTGALISSVSFADVSPAITFVSGATIAQDGTIMFVDQSTLSIYNYNDLKDASSNPAIIARDMLQKFGAHTYEEFDLSWMQTARQLSSFRARAVLDKKSQMIKEINKLLGQFNTTFFLRFNKYALFYIHFDNFRTNGKYVSEKDMKADTFKPGKEMNQYFNAANANYGLNPFTAKAETSDTYVSTAAISFSGKEYQKTIEMPSVYRRQDLDRLIPLHVRLAAPEPEFIDVTFAFRVIRTQMQDFMLLTFDDSAPARPGLKSGRRFTNVPCMVRKIQYDLGPMTVSMKLWSLGGTAFGGYTPPGATVGGKDDQILLSSLGRLGRISPVGTLIAQPSANTLRIENVYGQDAQVRSANELLAWQAGHRVSLVNGDTKEVLQTLTIDSVNSSDITFIEDVEPAFTATVKNAAGFISGGLYLQYASYNDLTGSQKDKFASYGRPSDNYPASRTQELEEQRGGVHNFDDGGLPYILYPLGFNSNL